MSATSPIFKIPKSRRLVSAWVVQRQAEHAVARVREFQDIFDQVILMGGGVKPDASLPDRWPQAERKQLVARFREMNVSVLQDWAGGWQDGFEPIARSPQLIAQLVRAMVEDCEAVGADGVDIDLEHLPHVARFPFTEFFAQLSRELHARNLALSIATHTVSAASRRDWGTTFIDIPEIARLADHVRPMCYDFFGPWTPTMPGPTSAADWTRDRMEYMVQEIPKHKLVAGLPTYSVDWDLIHPEKSRQIYDSEWIEQRKAEAVDGLHWISAWDVHFVRYNDGEGHPHLLYISDARSTRSHLVTVDGLDLAGVCFWCLMGDDPAIWQGIREHFGRR